MESMQIHHNLTCPHCWQVIDVVLDLSAGGQQYVQDCEVCCNPLEITYEVRNGEVSSFEARDLGQ